MLVTTTIASDRRFGLVHESESGMERKTRRSNLGRCYHAHTKTLRSVTSVRLTTRVLITAVGSNAGSYSGAPSLDPQTVSLDPALAWFLSVPLRISMRITLSRHDRSSLHN